MFKRNWLGLLVAYGDSFYFVDVWDVRHVKPQASHASHPIHPQNNLNKLAISCYNEKNSIVGQLLKLLISKGVEDATGHSAQKPTCAGIAGGSYCDRRDDCLAR